MRISSLVAIVSFLYIKTASSQTYDAAYLSSHPRIYTKRTCFWFEGNLNLDLSSDKRFQFQLDYQLRRTSDPSYIAGGSNNMFKDRFQTVYRPWFHYWIKPGAIRFSLSPIGYWISWVNGEEAKVYPATRGSHGEYGSFVYPEFRVCPQITTVQKFGRIEYSNRFRYEFRYIGQRTLADNNLSDYTKGFEMTPDIVGSPNNDTTGRSRQQRLRWQVRTQIPLSSASKKNQLYLNCWNELFLSFGKYVGTSKILNQDRVIALVGHRWAGRVPIKLELGVTEQIVFFYNIKTPPTQPASVNYNKQNVELNTALQVYLVFDSFQNLFKAKEKQTVNP